MSPMIDHIGPIASSLEDVAMLLKPVLKVGLLTEAFSVSGLSPDVAKLIKQTTYEAFTAAGASVTITSVPMHAEAPVIWTPATRPSMSQWLSQGRPSGYLSYLAPHIAPQWPPDQQMYELLNRRAGRCRLSGGMSAAATAYPAGLEAKAHREVFELRAAYDRALDEVDVLVLPCTPTVSMPHPDLRENGTGILEKLAPAVGLTSNTCPFNNITEHPAMSVPCGTLPVVVEADGERKEV
ncbi:amidase signature domain-containing protein [Microdochium trichocladiopsis]|uniref:Amidase signature domain-containing protein n=1 Tax=Microdochium trichocladiopsis TaxID=1682393 RepID=A0A9P8XXE8_9PEZI|nr:amidase signature domain-containing protein [Microdochium trichocladiopsis]KAH7024334.1 amidase signature domain-containing protein [Microdochium trichocladiopsis]